MSAVQELWYKKSLVAWLLGPLSVLFCLISGVRRSLFRAGIKTSSKPDAFIIVVGNITVGGNGKTPVVLAVVEHFKTQGVLVGVLSRGYGGTMTAHPHLVSPNDDASVVGDEPSLIARRAGVPVVIDPIRARGAAKLADELGCKVIVCDDGLQHYALKRDLELVVMDKRLLGNGHLLPMGPLREKPNRLASADALILNGDVDLTALNQTVNLPQDFGFTLIGNGFVNVRNHELKRVSTDFTGKRVSALAGIGHPQRFFKQLSDMGVDTARCRAFADHHHFQPEDLPDGTVLMTEKDAVKVREFAHEDCWYLPVKASFPTTFYAFLHRHYVNYSKEK